MSTNAILAVLYIELALFLVAIIWPLAARMLKVARTPREQPVSGPQRDLVVSRLTN
jgi:hypothetical protein